MRATKLAVALIVKIPCQSATGRQQDLARREWSRIPPDLQTFIAPPALRSVFI